MDPEPGRQFIISPRTGDTVGSTKTGKSFFGSIIRKESKVSDGTDYPKGSFGLTTLHEPHSQVPVADLVFVHGLNGGSQSTWTKGDDSNFWPKNWLPNDEAFADVRIHSFGYHSGLTKESVLNIQDFSRSLLGAIHDAPSIPRNQRVPLVLVGHSMGGLVIKKAYVLGHQAPGFRPIVDRVCAMFFLAVPHQGASISQTFNRLLSLHGSRPFVNDLIPSSPALQSINDEFPRLSLRLLLFSFFETRSMNYGVGKGLIVEKQAAVLNYTNERRTYLDANHRDVARFSSPDDPSYITIRNALATLIGEQRDTSTMVQPNVVSLSYHEDGESTFRLKDDLSKFLGVQDAPEDDLMSLDSCRLPGSCEWLLQRATFTEWRDALSSKVYWLRGRPGAGKSVISSAVISHLRQLDRDCCFFFFVRGDKGKVTINSFLRSMAFQMAILHPEVLNIIIGIASSWSETSIDKNDSNVVWRKLFLTGVLKARLNRPQYWIIDALDEARGGPELAAFLSKAQELWPLCIFITSRNSIDPYTSIMPLRVEIISEILTEDDNQTDISLFLDCNFERFPAPTPEARRVMAQRIQQNSRGCFLWAQLVVKELLQVRTLSQADRVINSNPSDMNDLYLRILQDMSQAKFNQELVKAILTWATCSLRPLYMDELQHAIQMDIKDQIGDMEGSINDCCGNLVYVDKLKKLQLIHLTVRELLMRHDIEFEYRIDRGSAHQRLAMVCLEQLSGPVTKLAKVTRRRSSVTPQAQDKSPFADYAACFLFHHLSLAKSHDKKLLIALTKFLKSNNVLSWIEYVARHFDLQKILSAGKIINQILERWAEHSPSIGLSEECTCMALWANDLIHLVTKFGRRLTTTPSAIHNLIPPFCPSGSVIREQFDSPRGLAVHGLHQKGWDDCLSTMSYTKPTRPHTIAASADMIALGTSTGKVIFYNHTTLQESQSIEHKEWVWTLAFGRNGKMMATAGSRFVRIWDVESGAEIRTFRTTALCIALAFDDEDGILWAAMRNNVLLCWSVSTGELYKDPVNWTADFEEEGSELHARAPVMAVFCVHMNLLALVYRGEDLIIWELDEEHVYDVYEKDTGSRLNGSTKLADGVTTVWDVAFSAATGTSLLAAAYSDGDLIVYDTATGCVVNALTDAYPQTLCSSPDGRTLAAGDSRGNIELFDFETLKFLYKIQFEADALKIRTLAFTADNFRLIEIRGNQCRIWEPSVLLRQDADDDTSDMVSVSTAPLEIEYRASKAYNITAIACVRSAPLVFCGKEDGGVYVYDISQEPQSQQLFVQTQDCPIILLYFDPENNILACSDVASRVTARRVTRRPQQEWEISDILLDTRPARKISQMLASGKHGRLLLSTDKHDTLWPLQGQVDGDRYLSRIDGTDSHRWVSHINGQHLILVGETKAKIFNWAALEYLTSVAFGQLDPPLISSTIPLHHHRFFATVSKDAPNTTSNQRSAIHVWDMNDFIADDKPSNARPAFDLGTIATRVESTVGVIGDRLVFLDKDSWVCSIDLNPARDLFRKRGITTGSVPTRRESAEESSSNTSGIAIGIGSTVRHFFVPYDWISLVNELHVDVGPNGDIVFVKRSELAVIRRGLEFSETGPFNLRRVSNPIRGLHTRPTLQTVQDGGDRHSI
ncbi:hypothetical protein BJ170DRAFT_687296 [Xylariales sp. AK1849]|nr:hypothetical protein BJ170DRAFT_687296 [Xylariales sp. AK1849]